MINLIIINYYLTHVGIFICGLKVNYIVELKPIQGPLWFKLRPNLILAKSLFRTNMISIQNHDKTPQNTNSKHHRKDAICHR
jgi:hypothetical protein